MSFNIIKYLTEYLIRYSNFIFNLKKCDANKFDYVFDYAPATEQNNQNGSQQAVELWQFLLELLEDRRGLSIIHWVSNSSSAAASGDQPASTQQTKETATTSTASLHDNEFVILDPIEVSKRWALRRNKPFTTYKKFNRILRSYYNKKKILHKTAGKANAFAFQINVQPYLNQIRSWQQQQMQDFSKMRHY